MASVIGSSIHRLKHINIFVDLLCRGHWSKAASFIHIVLASLSNITDFITDTSRKNGTSHSLFPHLSVPSVSMD